MAHYHHQWVKARKEHTCSLCHRTIRPGEKYLRGVGMGEGTAWTWRECSHCEAVRDVARAQSSDSEYGEETFIEWEPQTVPQLRLKAMWRRKWQRGDGTLYPVPRKVRHEDVLGFSWQVDAVPGDVEVA